MFFIHRKIRRECKEIFANLRGRHCIKFENHCSKISLMDESLHRVRQRNGRLQKQ